MYRILSFIVFLAILNKAKASSNCSFDIKLLCIEKESCNECLVAHHCCNWCYDQNKTNTVRCNLLEELNECEGYIEKNANTHQEVDKDLNKDFTEIKTSKDAENVIQIKPQGFHVQLRKDVPINLTFTYKAAKNYPLELYYLGDLSYSMESNLNTLKNLGDDLGHSLKNLTLNYKLAYGSFMDKPEMPFYYTDEQNMENPCRNTLKTCEKGYLFKHRLDFTSAIQDFFDKVKNSKITANVDDLDGALDAILQILVCKNFGWTRHSRKLILLPTDSFLHTAGDGLLVGAVLKPEEECLMDESGNHTNPLKYDYPSVGQIDALLKKHKVNIIFAIKGEKMDYYKKLTDDILKDDAFLGELEENSENILSLVNTGFYNFIRQVQFSVNTSHIEDLEVKFFGDCFGTSDFNATSGCYNVEEDKPVQFILQLTLKKCPSMKKDIIYIKEKNINEEVKIDITYAGCNCDCQNYNGEKSDCGEHGEFECGQCICHDGWSGKTCSEECDDSVLSCRHTENGVLSLTCSGVGDCSCGRCDCESPFIGKYCQYRCPTNKFTGEICSGASHGKCIRGTCKCESAYVGEDCSCETSKENCKVMGNENICNGHGTCKCNTCICEEGYEGTNCEKTPEKNELCEIYEKYVLDNLENGTKTFKKNNFDIFVNKLENSERTSKCNNTCKSVHFSATSRCTVDYCYNRGQANAILLSTKPEVCVMTGSVRLMTLGVAVFLAIVLGGIIAIAFYKVRIYRADQAEYKRFINEQKNWNELNPIYRSPVTTFSNPMSR